MRGARWLLLVAMAVIVGGVSLTYRAQKEILRGQAPPKPPALPPELNSSANQWHWTETDAKGCKTANIQADDFREVKDSSRVDLRNVALKLYKKCSGDFDLVKSAGAQFFASEHRLYSDGDVEITLNVPADDPDKAGLVSIHSSGVTFDSNTGRAETDRPSRFTFRNGDGTAKGAAYDPTTRELQMKKDVEVNWRTANGRGSPMKIQAATLIYQEARSAILLPDWGTLTREGTVVEGYGSVVYLHEQMIQRVTSSRAHGTEDYPNRKLKYAAGALSMWFDAEGQVQRILGEAGASLVATSQGSETTVTAPTVDLAFAPAAAGGESTLSKVLTAGESIVTSKPLPVAGRPLPETHALRSTSIEITMRPDGREIQTLVTHAPGRVEFLPNLPAQHHRTLDGSDLAIAYGPGNRVDTFRAKDVRTVTDPSEDERARKVEQSVTTSKQMLARFDAGGTKLASMEQSGDFTYRQGERRARAAKAMLDSDSNVMVLDTSARVWDSSGSTSADHIRIDQRTGNFVAQGNVRSTRLATEESRNGMLSGDEPVEAQAAKMESANRNRSIHYEGSVSLWQGANRIEAAVVDIDREKQTLVADRNVVSNLWEQAKKDEGGNAAPVPIVVRAAHLVYTDANRLADYTGGVRLDRPGLQVKSRELLAYLADSSADSRLQKAVAIGAVEIVQKAPDRTRVGKAEHAEYFPDEQKVILREGKPQLVDSLKGETSGAELTYFANDDRFVVNGSTAQPAKSRLRRR